MDIGLKHAMKDAARNMSKPLIGDWAKLNWIGRFLVGTPKLVSLFAWAGAHTDGDIVHEAIGLLAKRRAASHPAEL